MVDDAIPPFRQQFDNARDPYTARNALGIAGTGAGLITSVSSPLSVTGGNLTIDLSSTIRQIVVQRFIASGTYTPTSGMKYCIAECIAGGGGGGGVAGTDSNFYVAGGGGSGAYSRSIISAAGIGASKSVTIGAAGNGGSAGSNNGTAGGDTSLGSLCVAKGGSGGEFSSVVQNGNGGFGGDGSTGTGDITAFGTPGGGGFYNNVNATIGMRAGAGGSSYFGGGAPPSAGTGSAAGLYGSGGGGGVAASGINVAGGNGSSGICIITEFI